MGSSESSERNNGDNNSTTTKDQARKDELKDMAKVAGAGAAAVAYGVCNSTTTTDQQRKDELKDSAKVAGAVAGVAAAAYGECSILASMNNKKEEDGLMMKAPGQKGVYIKRKDFEDNPAGYFKGNSDNILASINHNKEGDGPMMKAPSQNGVYIKRKDFEDDPAAGYFKGIRGNGNPHFKGAKSSINNNEEEDGPVMKAPGKKGVYIKRKDFEDDPIGYFKRTGGK